MISIILIIPKDILFQQTTANNAQYESDRSLFNHQMGGVTALIELIGLITYTEFNGIINRFEVSIN